MNRIQPARVQLNSVCRPPAEALKYLEALTESRKLERIVRDQQTFFTIPSRN